MWVPVEMKKNKCEVSWLLFYKNHIFLSSLHTRIQMRLCFWSVSFHKFFKAKKIQEYVQKGITVPPSRNPSTTTFLEITKEHSQWDPFRRRSVRKNQERIENVEKDRVRVETRVPDLGMGSWLQFGLLEIRRYLRDHDSKSCYSSRD